MSRESRPNLINRLLPQLKIRSKLIILLTFPLIGLMTFAVIAMNDRSDYADQMKQVRSLSELAVRIGNLLHDTQKERGSTALYIGSRGSEFAGEVESLRAKTDKSLDAFRQFLSLFDAKSAPATAVPLAEATKQLDQLPKVRKDATNMQMTGPEVIAFYTALNSNLLKLTSAISAANSDPEIGQLISAYSSVLHAKESAGQQRAMLSNALANGAFPPGVFRRFSTAASTEDLYLTQLAAAAPSDTVAFYTQTVSGPTVAEVEKVRAMALDGTDPKSLGIEATRWFAAQTEKIDRMKVVEDKLADNLKGGAESRAASARNALFSFAVLALFAFALASAMALLTGRGIVLPLAEISLAATRISKGDIQQQVEYHGADEVGLLADSFREVVKYIVEAQTLRLRIETENRELQENIVSLLDVVSRAADGDLTVRGVVTTNALGNVADAFNSMLESIQEVINGINKQVAATNRAVGEINSSSETMVSGATVQARELQQAVQLIDKMTKEIQRVSQTAMEAASAATRTEQSAVEGSTSVQNVVHGMETLRANVQAGAKKIKNLGDRSMEITGIVATIAKISEQTNMLALNAAIEAARAGEHGRGFSVVAEEVRKLAERTASATQEIEKLVRAIQAETNESVDAIEQQTQVVEQEAQIVTKAGVALQKIQEVSTKSAAAVGDISNIANNQVREAAIVVKTMQQISTIAQQTQTGATGAVRITKELSELAQNLTTSIARFKIEQYETTPRRVHNGAGEGRARV